LSLPRANPEGGEQAIREGGVVEQAIREETINRDGQQVHQTLNALF
jgi:hypothetical protein